jgi:hypothetical protein
MQKGGRNSVIPHFRTTSGMYYLDHTSAQLSSYVLPTDWSTIRIIVPRLRNRATYVRPLTFQKGNIGNPLPLLPTTAIRVCYLERPLAKAPWLVTAEGSPISSRRSVGWSTSTSSQCWM